MPREQRVIGRYCLFGAIAQGGMATVHLGRLLGSAGFARTVAIKRLHAQYARDPEFVSMFLDEARLAARIRHPNVVPTLDVVARDGELFLVMEYVHGETLARVLSIAHERGVMPPPPIVIAIVVGMLHGLHAAHEAKSESGHPLGIIHRDVSPQNVLVATDGVARVVDFGVAKAAGRLQTTRAGGVKGKLAYMAPEQLLGEELTRQVDIFGAGVVLWEALTGLRLFRGKNEGETVARVLNEPIVPPGKHVRSLPEGIDAITLKALERDTKRRWQTAREMAIALERSGRLASPTEVGEWLASICADGLQQRADEIEAVEQSELSVPPRIDSSIPPPFSDAESAQSAPLGEATSLAPPMPTGDESASRAGSFIGPVVARRRGRFWPVLALLAVLVLAIVAFARRSTSDASKAPDPALSSVRHAAAAPPPAATLPTPAPPAEESSAAAAPPPSAAPEPTTPSSARSAPKPRPAVASPSHANCAQPYYVDAQGIRRVRRECFH